MNAPKKKRAGVPSQSGATAGEEVLKPLRELDRLLAAAFEAMREDVGNEETAAAYRGLYVSRGEVERLLARGPAERAATRGEKGDEEVPDLSRGVARFRSLARIYGLSAFDLNLVLLALAPELDLRYEQLYAYLQDNVTRKRPTVDLALGLLCAGETAKLERRVHFAPEAPLVRHGLLRLVPESEAHGSPLLAHGLKLDEQVIRFLVGQERPDARLAHFCRWVTPSTGASKHPPDSELKGALPDGMSGALVRFVGRAREAGEHVGVYFQGPEGSGRRSAAEALAGESGRRLLVVNLARAVASGATDYAQLFQLVLNDARLLDATLYLDGLDALRSDEHRVAYLALLEALDAFDDLHILAGSLPLTSEADLALRILTVPFTAPGFAARRALWLESLSAEGIRLDDSEADELASRFRLSGRQIAGAVRAAGLKARLQSDGARATAVRDVRGATRPTLQDLFAEARTHSRHGLSSLASKIEPKYGWDDIQLPDDQLEQLREICSQAGGRHVVYGEWGFGRKTSTGKGINALFTGPPGTGKTMAAEVFAGELRLDLYKIDLSQVVSKYIGETEKNLDRIFREARASNAILFFDEADALFGKRSEVHNAHDRFANIEIGYLLQKMEEFDGIAVLATNLRQNMDEAFVRRMQFIVEFPFPDESYRRRIWQSVFPPEAPLGEDVEFDVLARTIRLSGGHIKNIALAGAFYAAADGRVIRASHLARAARREYQKLGRKLKDSEWDAPSESVPRA